jgi:hypothetical protein
MSDDNVVSFDGQTKLPVSVERVLLGALEEHQQRPFDRVIIIASYKDDESPDYLAASEACAAINAWAAERYIHELHRRADLVSESD